MDKETFDDLLIASIPFEGTELKTIFDEEPTGRRTFTLELNGESIIRVSAPSTYPDKHFYNSIISILIHNALLEENREDQCDCGRFEEGETLYEQSIVDALMNDIDDRLGIIQFEAPNEETAEAIALLRGDMERGLL